MNETLRRSLTRLAAAYWLFLEKLLLAAPLIATDVALKAVLSRVVKPSLVWAVFSGAADAALLGASFLLLLAGAVTVTYTS